jgi:hypothetical protein
VARIEDEMIFLLAMIKTYLEQRFAAFCVPFSLVAQQNNAQAAIKYIANYAWHPLTPLPAPVLRLCV